MAIKYGAKPYKLVHSGSSWVKVSQRQVAANL